MTKPVDFTRFCSAMPKLGFRWLLLPQNGHGESTRRRLRARERF